MPRTTLALKFGLYSPALIGPLFLILSMVSDSFKWSRGSGLQDQLAVAPALVIPAILVLSYLAFSLPSFLTGVLAALYGPAIPRWEMYQVTCAAACGVLTGFGYLMFVWLMGAITVHDRVLFWVAVMAGAISGAAGARWTRSEHLEASNAYLALEHD